MEDRLLLSRSGPLAPLGDLNQRGAVNVMTYNLDDGADLTPILTDVFTGHPEQIPQAVSALWAEVQSTDIPARAQAVAGEIAAAHPDLVGLQEATVWTVNGVPQYDMLTSLVNALAARGQHYAIAEKDPAFAGALPDVNNNLIGVQDQEAILVRTDLPKGRLRVSDAQSGTFAAHLSLPLPGLPGPLPVVRGWGSVDVQMRGQRFRFINTHLGPR
jgi:hypothetical protein